MTQHGYKLIPVGGLPLSIKILPVYAACMVTVQKHSLTLRNLIWFVNVYSTNISGALQIRIKKCHFS